jgi:hypothetical protein
MLKLFLVGSLCILVLLLLRTYAQAVSCWKAMHSSVTFIKSLRGSCSPALLLLLTLNFGLSVGFISVLMP